MTRCVCVFKELLLLRSLLLLLLLLLCVHVPTAACRHPQVQDDDGDDDEEDDEDDEVCPAGTKSMLCLPLLHAAASECVAAWRPPECLICVAAGRRG